MHVDGFRFDLASILDRDETGRPLETPPVLWDIQTDPILAGTKLIAEAWAAGLYQVGSFIGDTWREWNGRYRDDVRRFVKGGQKSVRLFAQRLLGSPDIYGHLEREPGQSINFVTCHDGFTLNDLVSYNNKLNEPNGEVNHDGQNDNCPGIAGSRVRARMPRSRVCAAARSRISLSFCCCQWVPRCCRWATRCAAPSTAITTPIARTTM